VFRVWQSFSGSWGLALFIIHNYVIHINIAIRSINKEIKMTAKDLKQAADLSKAFGEAVSERFGWRELALHLVGVAVDAGHLSKDYASLKIALADEIVAWAVSNEGAKKVAKLVPEELKSEENIAILRSMNAEHLVAICTRPAPRQKRFKNF
jgi:hypothetical protein